jgi:iron complex outermembrane receptor protein
VSRAVRTPSRADRDLQIDLAAQPPGVLIRLVPNSTFRSEELIAYELGYRVQPHAAVSLDAAAFYNVYNGQRTVLSGPLNPGPPPYVPVVTANARNGNSYGGELALAWQALAWWRMQGAFSYVDVRLPDGPSGADHERGDSPRNQLFARSSMELPRRVELDGDVRYVDALPAQDVGSYVTADVRAAWKPRPDLELSLVGQNLLQPRHLEMSAQLIRVPHAEVERGVYGKVTWKF